MGRRGIALVMTLWILAFLSVLGASYVGTIRLGTAAVRNFKEDAAGYYRAVAGFEEAVAYLVGDDDPGVDYIDENGLFRTGPDVAPFEKIRRYPDGTAEVEIVDLDSRVNVNRVTPELFERILSHAGYEDEQIREAVDALMDWRDPDDQHRLNGAETDYYEDLDPPYLAKNGPLDSVEELALVKGLDRALTGSPDDGIAPIGQHFTVRSSGPLNINTVSSETMNILGLTSLDIDNVLAARSGSAGPIRSVNTALFPGRPDLAGLIQGTSSRHVRVVASAANADGKNRHTIVGELRRIPGREGGFRVEILYWKDDGA